MNRLRTCLSATFAFAIVVATQLDLSAQEKAPVPDTAAQATARKMAADIYADRFVEAKNADEKATLAAEIIDAALKVQDGLPGQYVLLTIARDVAAGAGDAATALKAVGELGNRFEVETARMQGETLLTATHEASTTAQRKTVTERALDVIGTLADAGEYELALKICDEARTVATRTRDYAVARALSAKEAELKQAEKGSRGYREALAVLDKNPIDPQANLAAGRYLCFVQGDWDWGIPMLALGSEADLKAAAARDLRGSDSGEGQMALGDAWWDLAQSMKGPEREVMLLRAGSWYRQAEPKLAGDLRALKLKQRLEEIANLGREIPATTQTPPLATASFDAPNANRLQILWSKHLRGPVVQTNSIGMRLVLLPPGEFMMGSTEEAVRQMVQVFRQGGTHDWVLNRIPSEAPQHRVRITRPFYIGMCEVTQAEYQRVMGVNPSRFRGDTNLAVGSVTWHEATEFCRKLSELPEEKAVGAEYRLPTEAEWEYACRAGTVTRYYFGDDPKMLRFFAYGNGNSQKRLQPVGRLRPNAWHLLDMLGNAWEWCSDLHSATYYSNSPVDDPAGPDSGNHRVLRGGSCMVAPDGCRSSFRFDDVPDMKRDDFGFRVVRLVTT